MMDLIISVALFCLAMTAALACFAFLAVAIFFTIRFVNDAYAQVFGNKR